MEPTTIDWARWQDQQAERFAVRVQLDGQRWWAEAVPHGGDLAVPDRGAGDTPADALRALADILDEAQRHG